MVIDSKIENSFVEEVGFEVGVVEKIVGDAVDVPGDRDAPDKAHHTPGPPGHATKGVEEQAQIGEMADAREDGNNVPVGVSEKPGVFIFGHVEFSIKRRQLLGSAQFNVACREKQNCAVSMREEDVN